MGPLRGRPAVGHCARGLFGQRRRLELYHPRPGPQPRLPLGRRGPGRLLRRPAAALFRPGPLERAGCDSERAPVWVERAGGQPRRGREGGVLLPRCHAHALVSAHALQVPAARFSLRVVGEGKRPPRPFEARIRADGHGHLPRKPLLRRVRGVRQGRCRGRAHPAHHRQPRARRYPAAPAAAALVSQHLGLGSQCVPAGAGRHDRGPHSGRASGFGAARAVLRRSPRAAVLRKRHQQRPSL